MISLVSKDSLVFVKQTEVSALLEVMYSLENLIEKVEEEDGYVKIILTNNFEYLNKGTIYSNSSDIMINTISGETIITELSTNKTLFKYNIEDVKLQATFSSKQL